MRAFLVGKSFDPEFSKYVPEGHMVDSERYRKLDQNEKRDGDNMLFSGSFPRILPSRWISPLRFREKPHYFFDGSASGYVHLNTQKVNLEEQRGAVSAV